jgi:hypothetical protein
MLKSKVLSVATLTIITLLLASCEKDEIPVETPTAGLVESDEVAMQSDYRNQLFYDLELGRVVSENLKTDWDLGFECTADGWRITTNTGKGMKCAHTDFTQFNQEINITNLEWAWDSPSGNLDSTAIGNWKLEPNKLMVIDRGFDWNGEAQGYAELKILSYSETEYTIEFSASNQDEINVFTVTKDPTRNLKCFSFNNPYSTSNYSGSSVDIQPDRNDWDLFFTQYLAELDDGDQIIPYLVVGVLTNYETSFAQQVFDIDFEEIDLEYANTLNFDSNIDNIGYDWKVYDFQDGFITYNDRYYVIKDTEGVYFKLRFLDFYNLEGEKGHPNFELQRL